MNEIRSYKQFLIFEGIVQPQKTVVSEVMHFKQGEALLHVFDYSIQALKQEK